ncbi:Positive regulator of CheA protein activity (CheW) [hydrothermal vent metagenome]|uniref:Chemotaxis protein CheW n=1 Tax=hydrothermal vent metagenome TaxID=652676 RepID=A0A3B1AJL9_9ZZZZ
MAEATQQEVNNIDDRDKREFLTFMLAGEEYGVDILRVQEIKGWDEVTNIPNTPEYIRGVINLRGSIVPIIDMRLRFNLESKEYNATTVVVVLRIENEKGSDRTMGVVVDGVSDVYNVPIRDIKPSPDFGLAVDTEFVNGLATVDEKMIIVLNIDHMLNAKELAAVEMLIDET